MPFVLPPVFSPPACLSPRHRMFSSGMVSSFCSVPSSVPFEADPSLLLSSHPTLHQPLESSISVFSSLRMSWLHRFGLITHGSRVTNVCAVLFLSQTLWRFFAKLVVGLTWSMCLCRLTGMIEGSTYSRGMHSEQGSWLKYQSDISGQYVHHTSS